MIRLEGMPISPGYANGLAVVYDYELERRVELPSRSISNLEVQSECGRLDDALERSSHDLNSVEQSARYEPRLVDTATLLSAHSAIAKEIVAIVRQHIGRELVKAEEALDAVIREFVERFGQLDSTCFREREQDVRDVGRRMMGHLSGSPPWPEKPLPPGSVIVARELLPSETVELAKSGVVAIVAEHGGRFSHTAIVARSLGIPAVTGIADVTSRVQPGMRLLVDGESGSVVLAPSEAEEASFVDREREFGIRLVATATEEEQVRELLQNLPSAEARVSRQTGQPSEPSTVTLSGAPVATQLSGPATDRRQSLRDMNESLTQRVAESTSRLSTANALLTAARQDERLAAVAFETHDSIVITDKDGKILRVNKSFTELNGYASEEVVGKSPRVLKSGLHGEEFYREMWQTIQVQGYWQGEIWNRRKDGHIYPQRLTITCVKNDSGEITHYVGDGQDLTQQKQGEADLAAISAARKVQRTLFPSCAPCLPGFDIAGAVHPAERVSGDFFDYIPLGQDSIGVLVADVSGHGLGPALLMAQTQAYLRALAETCADPGELLAGANRLFATNDPGHFVTMFLGRLDVATRSFSYVAAGHQGYLIANDGAVRVLHSHTIPLGVERTMTPCPASRITFEAGDILVVPTDGAEEAMSVDGRQFGRERIFDLVRNNKDKPAVDIVEALFLAARDFAEQRPQEDDITALIVKVLPSASARTSAKPNISPR